ncbi:MAG TPA: protein kinase, partial [Candidatus Polarisedimenticolaceae bacterium]|nr:protein kinase [Candidatus Polarisedimenticolaceae bacterium]
RLGREVAVKVLPPGVTQDPERRARFEREAKLLASLNHPHVATVHGFEETDGTTALVMELVQGEDLSQRIARGPIPFQEALDLARQIASALDAAHESGVVHRDLKPANVRVTPEGVVKVVDFGLAKGTGIGTTSGSGPSMTVTSAGTAAGMILGTAAYMSPEQARGKAIDRRTDVWAFACLLYEMLTAKPAFGGETVTDVLAAIVHEEPDYARLPREARPRLERLLRRCLAKDPRERASDLGDVALILREIAEEKPDKGVGTTEAAPRRLPSLLPAAVLLLVGGAIGWLGVTLLRKPPVVEPVKITPLTHSGRDWSPSASPDGRTLAFASNRDGRMRIWLRDLKGGTEIPLTEGGDDCPRFSPDGSSVLFLRGAGSLRSVWRVLTVGGQPRKVLDLASEAIWSPDGNDVAFLRPSGNASKVETTLGIASLKGGAERVLARYEGRYLYGLAWSPDGKWLSVSVASAVQNTPHNSLIVFDAATGAVAKTVDRPARLSMASWDRDSRSLVVAQSTSVVGDVSNPIGRVFRLDPFTGRERALFWVQSVYTGGTDIVRFDTVREGALVFDEYDWRGTLEEIGISGKETPARFLTHGNSRDRQPVYSRGGDLVLFSSNRSGNLDLWTLNLATGDVRQVTDDSAEDWDPAFTFDGRGILWSSSRSGHLEIWTANADGTSARQLSRDGLDAENPTQTADGAYVVYASGNPKRNGIWRMRSDGSDETQLVKGDFFLPEVSPDGRYVAYGAAEPARNGGRVFVAEVATGKVVWTTDVPFLGYQAAVQPGRTRWMPDGRTLVLVVIDPQGQGILSAQDFRPGEDTASSRRVLLATKQNTDIESFGISPDGTHVAVSRIEETRSLKLAEGVPGFD